MRLDDFSFPPGPATPLAAVEECSAGEPAGLDEFDRLYRALEAGRLPAGSEGAAGAARVVLDRLRAAPWATAEQRERAHVLALRLAVLVWRGG